MKPRVVRALPHQDAARTLDDGSCPLVFPSRGGRPLDEKRLRWLLSKHRDGGQSADIQPSS